MKYISLYNKITNPLDDPQVLEQLIGAYSEGSSFYSALTNRYSKEKKRYYSVSARDALHSSIFNRWKKELLSITPEQYEKAISDGLYKRNIFKLISFLKTVPDVTTMEEINEVLKRVYKDKELDEAMEDYRWDSIGMFSSWTHISERHINGKKTVTPKIEHRLYINTDLMDVHYMSKLFMDKCIEKKLPFYFKIGEGERRDDNIVIYSDTKLLPHYLSVLKEIEEENPELVKRCGRPPILSGVIRNWIGYGSEPIKLSGEESFNGVRAKSIEKAIDDELLSWYRNHQNATIMLQGKNITLSEYIARQVVKSKVTNMIDYRKRNPQNSYIKYTVEDINSKEFVNRMAVLVNRQMPSIFNDYINGKKPSVKIEVPIKGDVKTTIYTSDITRELKKFILIIKENDPGFIKRIRERIIKDAAAQGIDPNKYCFDVANVELLKKADMDTASKQKQQPKKETSKPVSKKSTDKDSETYHRPAGTPTNYRPMTDEEILASQRKLAECPPVQATRKTYVQESATSDIPKYHRPAGTPTNYRPMTDEEILASQRKLAECPPVKVKRR